MKGELLWVYEGLTEYLGRVLPARSGLWSADDFHEAMAAVAAEFEMQSGRQWRPLVDTAVAVQFTYPSPRAWMNYRRRVDYYDEGSLVWLDADVLIRQRSNGKLSLDDFCRRFHGGADTAPLVKTYTFDDVVNTLNEVVPYDWRRFLTERIYQVAPHAPLAGITGGGWKLVYTDKPNTLVRLGDHARKSVDLMYSIGAMLKEDGGVMDVNPNLDAAKAGLAPGMKITTVNGRAWSTDVLHAAITAAKKQYHTDRISCRKRQFYRHVQVELSRRRTLPTSRARLDKTRRTGRGDQVAALRTLSKLRGLVSLHLLTSRIIKLIIRDAIRLAAKIARFSATFCQN